MDEEDADILGSLVFITLGLGTVFMLVAEIPVTQIIFSIVMLVYVWGLNMVYLMEVK